MKNRLLMVASSDGYCSFIRMDPSIIGELLATTDEAMPECFKDHFSNLSNISFEQKIEEATAQKQSSFTKIGFKSKKPVQPIADAEMIKAEDPKDSWCGPSGDVEMR